MRTMPPGDAYSSRYISTKDSSAARITGARKIPRKP